MPQCTDCDCDGPTIVIFRNMYVSSNGARTWVEMREPIMKAYVAWKTGVVPCIIGPQGDGTAEDASVSANSVSNTARKRAKTEGFNNFLAGVPLFKGPHAKTSQREGNTPCTKESALIQPGQENMALKGRERATERRDKRAYFFNPFCS
jgi:hypothetical protein